MQQKSNQLIIHLFSLSLYQSPANRKKGGQALKIWKWQPSVFNHTASCICFLPLSDIDLVCEISVVSHTKVKPMWKNAPSVIRRLTEKEDIKRSVMFSKCNQFLSTGSKLSTTHCTKSHRGHQIHANPSLHHHVAGDGGQSAQRHIKHRLCTNTLPGHKAPPRVWWGGTSPLQTNRSKWARSIRPSDFDLVLTHDVGPYVNSRACVSEGVGGVLWHYLPTAAVAARTMSIISIQRVRPQSPQLCGHEEEKRNSSANELSLWSRPLAGLVFRARFLQQVTHNAENHRKPVNSLRGRSETYAAPFLPPPPPLLTTLTSSNITSCEWQHDRIQKPVTFLGSVDAWGMANCVTASNRIQSFNSKFHRKEKVRCLLETCIWWWCCRPRTVICTYIHANKYTVTHPQPSHMTRKQSVDQESINQQLFWLAINRFKQTFSG